MSALLPSQPAPLARRAVRAAVCRSASQSWQRASTAHFASVAAAAADASHSAASSTASSSSFSSPSASTSAAAEYSPRWQYAPSSTRRPSRSEVVHTYHSLLRLVRQSAQGQQQLWAKQRSEHWQAKGQSQSPLQQPPVAAAGRSGGGTAPLFEYGHRWVSEVRRQYRLHQHETDERRIGILHSDAVEYAALLDANLKHSREVYEAGWGMQQATKAHVSNTARRVGLSVSESMLEREVEAELREEAKERGEEEWNVDETIARLEAVERRKKKELDSKAHSPTATTPATNSTTRKNT